MTKHSHIVSAQPTQDHRKSWRDILPAHPAADLFPMMTPAELQALADDIKANGLTSKAIVYYDKSEDKKYVLDGRNRLDALALLGISGKTLVSDFTQGMPAEDFEPYAFVISKNIHRRHLTSEQKRELIAKVLKANPEKSDRQIAKIAGRSKNTVATERKKLESTGQIDQLEKHIGADGKERKARHDKKRATEKVAGSLINSSPAPEVEEKPSKSSNPFHIKEMGAVSDSWIELRNAAQSGNLTNFKTALVPHLLALNKLCIAVGIDP